LKIPRIGFNHRITAARMGIAHCSPDPCETCFVFRAIRNICGGQPELPPGAAERAAEAGVPLPPANGPDIFTALREQLSVRLDSHKGPIEVMVIDHVEKPTEN
jgi:hypothetical protein